MFDKVLLCIPLSIHQAISHNTTPIINLYSHWWLYLCSPPMSVSMLILELWEPACWHSCHDRPYCNSVHGWPTLSKPYSQFDTFSSSTIHLQPHFFSYSQFGGEQHWWNWHCTWSSSIMCISCKHPNFSKCFEKCFCLGPFTSSTFACFCFLSYTNHLNINPFAPISK